MLPRLYDVSTATGVGALLGVALAGLAASKIGTGTSQPASQLRAHASLRPWIVPPPSLPSAAPCTERGERPARRPRRRHRVLRPRAGVEQNAGSPASPTAEDVAEAIHYVLSRSSHVSIEVLIRPPNLRA